MKEVTRSKDICAKIQVSSQVQARMALFRIEGPTVGTAVEAEKKISPALSEI